jgi:hypothetical protein
MTEHNRTTCDDADAPHGGCFSFFISQRLDRASAGASASSADKASTAFSTRSTGYGSAGRPAQNTAQQDGTACNLHPLCAIAFSLAAPQDDAAVSTQALVSELKDEKDEKENGLPNGGVGGRKGMKRAFKKAAWAVLESVFDAFSLITL